MILYKYLTPERIGVLETKQIRFTQPIYLNDQYEALPAIQQLMTSEGFEVLLRNKLGSGDNIDVVSILKEAQPSLSQNQVNEIAETISINNLIPEIYPILINLLKAILTESHSSWMTEASKKFKESASNRFGILSLSEVYDNQTMWAHYANNNKGFVIEFDANNSFFNQRISESDQIRFIRPVLYSSERPIWPAIDQNSNEKDFILAIHQVFLTKNIDWEKEKEWRMIMPLEKANTISDNKVYLFEFPAKCVKKIILGPDIEEKDKDHITNIVKNNPEFSHVKISQASINNTYSFTLTEIT